MRDVLETLEAVPESLNRATDRARRLVMTACESLGERYQEPKVIVSQESISLQWTRGDRTLVVGVRPDRPMYRCQCVWGVGDSESMETLYDALDLVKWVMDG